MTGVAIDCDTDQRARGLAVTASDLSTLFWGRQEGGRAGKWEENGKGEKAKEPSSALCGNI